MHNKVVLFLSVNKHVVQNINSFLEECGKTGADMSRDLGLSNATYSNWNLYKTNVSKKYFPLIADWLSKQLSRKIFVSDLTAVSSTDQQKKPTAQGDGLTEKQKYAIELIKSTSDDDLDKLIEMFKIWAGGK
jgi:hypothetical protein